MTAVLGFLGTLALVLCGFPLLLLTIRDGHCRGVSAAFLALWFAGEVLMLAHVLLLPSLSVPLALNYGCSVVLTGIVCWYRAWPRVKTLEEMVRDYADD